MTYRGVLPNCIGYGARFRQIFLFSPSTISSYPISRAMLFIGHCCPNRIYTQTDDAHISPRSVRSCRNHAAMVISAFEENLHYIILFINFICSGKKISIAQQYVDDRGVRKKNPCAVVALIHHSVMHRDVITMLNG